MKTRILHTKFWQDSYIVTLTHKEKLLFLYLITNPSVNICGIYELPDKYVCLDLDLTQEELNQGKRKFEQDGKFQFLNGWIRVINVDKYNSYLGEKNDLARKREMSLVPSKLIVYPYSMDTSTNTSMDTPIIQNTNHNLNQNTKSKSETSEGLKKLRDKAKHIKEMP